MPKPHRGKGIKGKEGSRPRGRCPVCGRTGVKLMYKDDKNQDVCKICRSKADKKSR